MIQKIKWVMVLLIVGFTPGLSLAGEGLELQVITSGAASMHANNVLIKGDKNMVLVDVPFTRSDTHRLIADILETGKHLETVIISHDHPDHFFGLDLIMDVFPDAKVVAHPQVVQDIWRSVPAKFKRWNPMLGNLAPHHPAVPTEMAQRKDGFWVELEGKRIEVRGPMQGDHVRATAIWVPSLKALIAGDLLYNEMFLWLGEHLAPQRLAWRKVVDRLEAMKPEIVVAGHKRPGMADDLTSISFTRRYLDLFEKFVASSKNSKELTLKIQKAFPNSIDIVDDFLLGYSTKVAMGEIPPWDE